MTDTQSHPLILFDGECGLCHASVRWVIRRDRKRLFRFASLQSKVAACALSVVGADPAGTQSVTLIDGGTVFRKSGATLRILRRLGLPWSLALVTWPVPRPIRDWVYGVVARNRYRWFGRVDECRLPSPTERELFLDASEGEP